MSKKRTKPTKKVLVDYEEKMSLPFAASYLQQIATKFKDDQRFTLTVGDESFDIVPSSQVALEIKLEQRGHKYKFEIELEWDESKADQTLSIE